MSKEMAHRTSRTRLIPSTEHPEDRPASDFKNPNLPGWIEQNRDKLMYALIIIVQNYLAKGRPPPERVKLLGSFESWSMTIGGILECAGIEGFQGNRRKLDDSADSETETWREMIGRWHQKYGSKLVLARDLFPIAEKIESFPLRGERERQQRLAFGNELGKWKDRVIGIVVADRKLIEVQVVLSPEKKSHSAQWRLVEVKND
jgi:putative DNA primase/helicase